MKFKREQIINALCNEYNHLFKDTYIPGIDLSFDEYKKGLEAKTLDELIKADHSLPKGVELAFHR